MAPATAPRRPKTQKVESRDYYCYIVECADGTFYTGWTTDLQRRVAAHNAGRGSRYTRLRRPVRLVYCERCSSRTEAMRREIALKRKRRAAKIELIAGFRSEADGSRPTSDHDPELEAIETCIVF